MVFPTQLKIVHGSLLLYAYVTPRWIGTQVFRLVLTDIHNIVTPVITFSVFLTFRIVVRSLKQDR